MVVSVRGAFLFMGNGFRGALEGREGFQRATAKPFGRARRRGIPGMGLMVSGPRRSAEGDRKALCPRPQARNPRNGRKGVWATPEGAGYLALKRNEVVWAPGGCCSFILFE